MTRVITDRLDAASAAAAGVSFDLGLRLPALSPVARHPLGDSLASRGRHPARAVRCLSDGPAERSPMLGNANSGKVRSMAMMHLTSLGSQMAALEPMSYAGPPRATRPSLVR